LKHSVGLYGMMVRKTGARQKMKSIYGAGFWSMCHGYTVRKLSVRWSSEW